MSREELGKTKFDKALEVLRESRKAVIAVMVAFTMFSIGFFDINVPVINPFIGEKRFIWTGMILGVVLFYIPAKIFVKRYYTVDSDIVFTLNAIPEDDAAMIKEYEIGKQKMNDMKINGQPLDSWRGFNGKTVYLGRNIDLENNEIENTHHAELDDIELLEWRNKVEEARIRSKKWSLIGIKLYSKFDTIVESIEARIWTRNTDNYMEVAQNAKKEVKSEVEEQIPELATEETESNDIQDIIDNTDASIDSVSLSTGKGQQPADNGEMSRDYE